ncbi:VWA domain-containing protein [Parahaliea mediterranea]|uniref:VWA domain-containing protein n=1 Tax=Parahaliea mediterranea TaxID=651086 RepID=UPI000E2ECF85|nr:VWA domain-containing protein [Parahaliea mediterranea]
MNAEGLHFLRPEWLWALLPAALLGLGLFAARRRSGSWSAVIDPELLRHLVAESNAAKKRNALPWLLLAWALACVALAGPSLHKIPQPVAQREDALVVILDLSYSMKAADLAPSRLDRARQKILDLLAARDEGQTALVAFAGDAHVVTPLTDDKATIANLLPALNPDMMPVPGSDAAGAVSLALELLHSGGARHGRLLLLTDGVAWRQHDAIAEAVSDAGAALTILGIGTRSGAPLPLPDGGFLKDAQGSIVVPGLERAELTRLARQSGGRYLDMQVDNADLQQITSPLSLPGQERLSAAERRADHWEDQGYLLIMLLLPVALLLFRRGVVLGLLALLWLGQPGPAQAQALQQHQAPTQPQAQSQNQNPSQNPAENAAQPGAWQPSLWNDLWLTPDQQGQRALQAGDFDAASTLFDSAPWAGTAAFKAGDFDAAAKRFAEGDSADDWYNRGNALARAGELDAAIEAYRESLKRQPGQADAEANIELLEQVKQQQQEQQQNAQNPNQGDNKQNPPQNNDGQQDSQGPKDKQNPADPGQQNGDQSQDQQDQQDPGQSPAQQPAPEDANQQEKAPEQAPGQAPQPEPQAGDPEEQPGQAQASAEPSAEQAERDQALEQWLRRVPDDPSGLLREKFRFESRQRQQQGDTPRDDQNW